MIVFIKNQQELRRFIEQESLVVTKPSLEATGQLNFPASLYFGIGLCSKSTLSQGLPIDILSMMFIAERLSSEKYLLIADAHARNNGFPERAIGKLSYQYQETLQRICENLNLQWKIIPASEVGVREDYHAILHSLFHENAYVRKEMADICWFESCTSIKLKLGWALSENKEGGELFFDQAFRQAFPSQMSFIYVEAGRTFNPRRLREAPYLCHEEEARILLSKGEHAETKLMHARNRFGKEAVHSCEKYLNSLLRLYSKIIGPVEKGPLEQRIQYVLDRCLQ